MSLQQWLVCNRKLCIYPVSETELGFFQSLFNFLIEEWEKFKFLILFSAVHQNSVKDLPGAHRGFI